MHSITTKTVAFVLLVTPFALLCVIGFAFLASPPPLRSNSPWLAVAPTSQITTDGRPAFLPIKARRYDAWMRHSDEVIGHVFARRDLATNEIKVVSAVHGRLLVPVVYDQQTGCFVSRCFGIRFDINGTIIHDDNANSSRDDDMPRVEFSVVDGVLFVHNSSS